ncbi:MAG TPA: aldo/keto reductase [Myxococcota bacterium]|nr:aldo/keto reductase [Myxococcota bacterium]
MRRPLGRCSLEVDPVVFGAWAIGGWFWGDTDDDKAAEAIAASIDHGVGWIDTAPIYGFGHSEHVIGRAIRGREVRIATKAGLRWDSSVPGGEAFFQTRAARLGNVQVTKNLRPESIRLECEASLTRLGVERIDLYQCHWPDGTTPVEDTMGALLELKGEGKIDAIGVSNFGPELLERAQRALGDVPLASTQPRYSALDRAIEADVLPWCREHEVAVIVYSPLEQGLLTGKVTAERVFPPGDRRGELPRFSPENRRAVAEALSKLQPIAEEHGVTLAQMSIAWTFSRPGVTAAIVGARDGGQAAENAAAMHLSLADEELARIDEVLGALRLSG